MNLPELIRTVFIAGLAVLPVANSLAGPPQVDTAQGKKRPPIQDTDGATGLDFDASLKKLKQHNAILIAAFKASSDGWSSDEVILQEKLNQQFLLQAQKRLATAGVDNIHDAAINWRLMALRKAGKLKIKATRRASPSSTNVGPAAEIAMRTMLDRTQLSSDRIMADPELRKQFDASVKALYPKASLYAARKAAFQLRKTRRLRPELISRFADWGRQVKTYTIEELKADTQAVLPRPGVYIFRDLTGYLYIGQSDNLQKRLSEHIQGSHNAALADYLAKAQAASVELHSFDPQSRAKETRVRRAYEAELIRSRQPKFNILP